MYLVIKVNLYSLWNVGYFFKNSYCITELDFSFDKLALYKKFNF